MQAKMQIMKYAIPTLWTGLAAFPECILATVFFAMFGIIIAIMKDVPDVKGDALNSIPTFSVKLGSKAIFNIASKALSTILGLTSLPFIRRLINPARSMQSLASTSIMALSLLTMAYDVHQKAAAVAADDSKQVFTYYMYIWKYKHK